MYFIDNYFGISGTFKGTTIKSRLKNENRSLAMYTDIKKWKSYEKRFGLPISNLNYAALHLIRLKNYIKDIPQLDIDTLLVERGVSDMIFYQEMSGSVDKELINDLLNEERTILGQDLDYKPNCILLIQEDTYFIKNIILKEKTRSDCFPGGVDEYLRNQEDYVNFTKKYNNISKVIEIKDAEKYITDLGLTFDPVNN